MPRIDSGVGAGHGVNGLRWCLLLCLLSSTNAQAAERGWYGGAAVGYSTIDIEAADWDDGTVSAGSVDDGGAAYTLTVGYRVFSFLALDIAWLKLPDTEFHGTSFGGRLFQAGAVTGSTTTDGVSVSAVGTWPAERRFALLGRLGFYAWDTEAESLPTLNDKRAVNNDGLSLIYGVGAEMRLYQRWRMRGEWQHTTIEFASSTFGADVVSLGLVIDF